MIFVLLFSLLACDVGDEAPETSEGTDQGPSAQQIEQCKDACDRQQFFDCYGPEDIAWCYGRCEEADASALELFTACVGNTFCDLGCDVHLEEGDPQRDPEEPDPEPDPPQGCEALCVDFAETCEPELASACDFACERAETIVVTCIEEATGCLISEECEEQLQSVF